MNYRTSQADGHIHIAIIQVVQIDGRIKYCGHTVQVIDQKGRPNFGHIHSFNAWEEDIIDNDGWVETSVEQGDLSEAPHKHKIKIF